MLGKASNQQVISQVERDWQTRPAHVKSIGPFRLVLCWGKAGSRGLLPVTRHRFCPQRDANNDLYCRTCKQSFSSPHNKKEHLLGKQHLQNPTRNRPCSAPAQTQALTPPALEFTDPQPQTPCYLMLRQDLSKCSNARWVWWGGGGNPGSNI